MYKRGFFLAQQTVTPWELIHLLRAFLRRLFTNDNREQVCLYVWGPGATGKSTFVQLLEHIMGESSCALDILRLTNRFEIRAVQDRNMITLTDVPLKVNETQRYILKKMRYGDKITCEGKNGPIYSIAFEGNVVITANRKLVAQDRSSGFRRRMLIVQTPRAATRRDPHLLEKLQKDASELVNWALSMPAGKTRIGQGAQALNELSGGGIDSSGVMKWILAKARYYPGNELSLSAKKVPASGSLYQSYKKYVDSHGIEPLRYTSFGDALYDFVRSQVYRYLVMKRKAYGRIMQA